jgi:hypothetical protein
VSIGLLKFRNFLEGNFSVNKKIRIFMIESYGENFVC